MSEFDELVEGFDGLTADEKALLSREISVTAAAAAPGKNTGSAFPDVEPEKLVQEVPGLPSEIITDPYDEPPHEPGDWPDEEDVREGIVAVAELRLLKPDHRPGVGQHYVVFGGVPRPVTRSFVMTEDEFVRSNLSVPDDMKDIDGKRQSRADRTLRMRYRGYVCGEMNTL